MKAHKRRKSLVTSCTALLLCIAMLVGSTFAWFTDDSSVNVNKIEAGYLDVKMLMSTDNGQTWTDAEGQVMPFKLADRDTKTQEEILWEPGCTYELPQLKIVNAENLALKFKLLVTGITGDTSLAEVLDVVVNGQTVGTLKELMANDDGAAYGIILPAGATPDANAPDEESAVTFIAETAAYSIALKMQESAGNQYQDKALQNMSFTVVATQYTYEYDSYGNTYDKDATYPVIVEDLLLSGDIAGKVSSENVLTEAVVLTDDRTGITTNIPAGTTVESGVTELTLSIKEDKVNANVTLDKAVAYDVDVLGVADNNSAVIQITMPGVLPAEQTAIQLFHDGVLMTRVYSSSELEADTYLYDAVTGNVAFGLSHFSNVTFGASVKVTVNGTQLTYANNTESSDGVVISGDTTFVDLNQQTSDYTVPADGKTYVLTWDSGTYQFNALTSNPIVKIFTNETPNPGTYFTHSIIVESGATVVLNGVNIRTDDGEDALQVKATEKGDTTTIYVADGTQNYLTGRSGIGIDGWSTGKSIELKGQGFLQATATTYACPGIGPADNSDGNPSITINVGHLRAHPCQNAAGIGGGNVGNSWRGFSSIIIEGGYIQSYSGGNAAAIGSGNCGDTGSITVKGGSVYCYNQPWNANWHAMGSGTYAGSCEYIHVHEEAYVYAGSYGTYGNGTNTINQAGFKATEVSFGYEPPIVPCTKFEVVFENTASYLYRVGNQDTVSLGTLFSSVSGLPENNPISSENVSVTFATVSGTTSGTYTANSSDWTKGTIQFSGLGTVKVTISDGDNCIATNLTLEVVNAKNVATGAEFYSDSGSIVLLSDLTLTKDILYGGTVYQKSSFSGNSALYGNGFTVQTAETDTNDVGLITLENNATMDNVRIIVADHTDVYTSGGGTYNSAVKVTGSNVTISNCYIQGGRAAIKSAANTLTLNNTTLNGGAFANLLVSSGDTVNLNNVTTAQYKTSNGKMGFGIMFEGRTTLNIGGSLNQYNWISSGDSSCFNYTFYDYSSLITSIFNDHAGELSSNKMNLSIMWGTSLDNITINDNANTGYTKLTITTTSSEMYAYTPAANSSVGDYEDNNQTGTQGIVKPEISYSFATEKGDDNTYVYYDGILHIGVVSGSTTEVDALVNASVPGSTSLTVSGSGFTEGKGSFTADSEGGVLTYTATVPAYNADGTKTDTTSTFIYTLQYAVEKAAWKPAEMSVTEGTVYYTYSSSDYYAYIPIYAGITIKDYDAAGNATTTTYDGKTAIDSTRFSYSISISSSSNGKYASWGDPATNDTIDDSILYIKTSEAINGQQDGEVYVAFSYVGNNGETVTCQGTYTFNSRTTSKSESCVTPDTLITLADGTQKEVQYLSAGDELLVWNMFTGGFDTAPAMFINTHGNVEKYYDVTYLTFSDGTVVKIIGEHAFWDSTLNQYVYLDAFNAAGYIGHRFNKQSTDADGIMTFGNVVLTGTETKAEYTIAYQPVTYSHLCCYVNGMLSMPGDIEGMFNYFEVDAEAMKYDEIQMQADIEKYGILTYEEFAELFYPSEFMYEAIGAKYVKVSVGKGLATIENFKVLAARYAGFFES